jgi:hypothetical protein
MKITLTKTTKVVLVSILGIALLFLGTCTFMERKNMWTILELNVEIFPPDFNLKLAKEKGIGSKRNYTKVQDNYAMLLSAYLNSLYDFASADAYLDSKGFQPIEDGNYYYNRGIPGSKYFYLRNNIHVERLSLEHIAYLKGDLASDDAKGIEIVKETYEEVLAIRFSWADGERYNSSYDRGSGGDRMPNTAIVFYVDYGNTYDDVEHYDNEKKDARMIDGLSQAIIAALQPSFTVDVVAFDKQWMGRPL